MQGLGRAALGDPIYQDAGGWRASRCFVDVCCSFWLKVPQFCRWTGTSHERESAGAWLFKSRQRPCKCAQEALKNDASVSRSSISTTSTAAPELDDVEAMLRDVIRGALGAATLCGDSAQQSRAARHGA